ncbi:MAG: MMPL family transporter [Campylobacterota bacterium]|nr:MMPL family transporter [Campylobacterota bacterium]
MIKTLYKNFILKYPKIVFSFITIFMLIMINFTLKLEIDASAETLLLKGDKDLAFTRDISKKFVADNFLIIAYKSKKDDLLSEKNIQNIKELSNKIEKLKYIKSITSIVNVPLLQSPIKPIEKLLEKIPNLETKGIDKELVKKEFLTSPIYKQNLVSDDFTTTNIVINLIKDNNYFELIEKRDSLLKSNNKELLKIAEKNLKFYRDKLKIENHNLIVEIRSILSEFQKNHKDIKLYLGGTDMVADDMIEFIKNDLNTFGISIILLITIALYILLKEIKWIFIALFISTISIIITSGFLGLFGWEISAVSSNFISLQLIMNISLIVHLIIKYKELNILNKNETQYNLVLNTSMAMIKPSFFVVITTMAGFSSLILSGIVPITDFGLMMSLGITISFLLTFILFPTILLFFKKSIHIYKDVSFTQKIANFTYNHKKSILIVSIFIVIFSITGANKLKVENSFINYFKTDTQIYQGMKIIDQKLGGTTPLDIIITFKENDSVKDINIVDDTNDELLDEFESEFEETQEDKIQYWFTKTKLDKIKEIHNYLESIDEIGKVLSLETLSQIGKLLNNNQELDGLTWALLNKELPKEYKDIILSPYVNIEQNMVRISTRVIDSMPNLQRDKLINKINNDLKNMTNKNQEDYKVTNLLVIYNNMLQSLFSSQIQTIGITMFLLFSMFLILFRDIKIATIAMSANIIPVGVIFGFMGWMNIPLDMMTITIAAISMGIAVDDTIHYIHRYNQEMLIERNVKKAIFNAHKTIGTAMFYTSTIIVIGFSILVLSNFIPTIYFGILIMIAMIMAILADLLLLPVLLLIFNKK